MDRLKDTLKKDVASSILAGIFLASTTPFFGVIARRYFSASPLHISLISIASGVGQLFTFYWGYIIRSRRDKLKMYVIPNIVARGVFLFTPIIYSISSFLLIIFLYQIISCMATPAYVEVVKAMYPDMLRGRIMGLVKMINNLVVIAVTPLSGQAISSIGFRWVFFVSGIAGIISTLIFSRIKIREVHRETSVPVSIKTILTIPFLDKKFGQYLSVFFMYGLGNWLSNPIYPIILVDKLQASTLQVGYISTITSILSAIFYIYWGRYIDKKNPVRVLFLVFSLDFMIPLGYLLSSIKPTLIFVFISAGISGIVNAGVDLAVMNTILMLAPKEEIASYMALHSTFVGIRGIIGPFLGASLYPVIGPIGIFSINIATALLGGFLMYRFCNSLTTI